MCGEVLLSLQRLDEAERYLRKALELNPLLTDAVADFGFLFLKRGDLQRAREYFERALELEPQNSKALQGAREVKIAQPPHS
jgi:tetratricopeptide (TPR) repeat protein